MTSAANDLHLLAKYPFYYDAILPIRLSCGDKLLATILACSLVDDRHVLQVVDVGAFNDEDGAANLEDVSNSEGMQCTLLSLGAETEPCAIRRPHICQIEASSLLLVRTRGPYGLFVADLCMVVAHLGVFLDTEGVLLVSSDRKSRLIHGNHAVAGGSLEDMELAHGRLRCRHHFELGETHLEHHVARQGDFLADHDECTGGRTYIAQVKVCQVTVTRWRQASALIS